MRKKLHLMFVIVLVFCVTSVASVVSAQSMNLDKYSFKPMEEIKLHFKAGTGFATNAWIGIIPSHVTHGSESENDKHDLTYQYLSGKASGVLIYKAPQKPGTYDFRMHNTDNNGKEVAHITFIVLGKNDAQLTLTKSVFSPGEDIAVTFKAGPGFAKNAWIGIVPSHVNHGSESENDKHDLTYQYLSGKDSGILVYKAPAKPGKYDFRMHDTDNNGKEVTFVSFSVK